jgi:methionine synthase I (cobalamin-dependent)/5,10-methylenetetrahydrofolate reductase
VAAALLDRLANGPPICCDGGMGVLLTSAVPRLRCPEEANLQAPDSVVELHLGFIRAGAELIETNTFGANRHKLAGQFLENDVEAINSAGVKLARDAREVSGRQVFIAGSIGPLGDVGDREEERFAVFAEQAAVLAGRGVDLFMVETFYDLEELETAVVAVRTASPLPIVALLTFDDDAETLGGATARDAADRLRRLDVAAMGANHGAGPLAALTALEQMGNADTPLAALPNLGLASLAGGRVIYPHATPEYLAEFAAQARGLGAKLIGGCCGITPVEIGAIRAALDEGRQPAAELQVVERELAVAALATDREETRLARDLREGRFVVSVQVDPPLGSNLDGLLELSRELERSGLVGYIDINERVGRAGVSSLMVAAAIERECGLETIPHLTTRDWTVKGLESLLLGTQAAGIRNVLAVTGDPPEVGDYPGSSGVYEIDAIGLTRLMSQLNRGEDFNGRPIDAPTSFFAGVAVNPTPDDLDVEVLRFQRKIEEGAEFAMTQLIWDIAYLDALLEQLGGSAPIPLLVGVWQLTSYQLALRVHNELPGVVVPEHVQEALRDAGSKAPEVGLRFARELVELARDRAAGVYIVAPFRRPLAALDVLAP